MSDKEKMENSKFKKTKTLIKFSLPAIFISVLVGLAVYLIKPTEIRVDFPYTLDSSGKQSYSCEALTGTYMYGDENEGIIAKTFKGTDKIAIEIENDNLKFLTGAAVGIGNAEGDTWNIVKNNDKNIVAVYNGLNEPLGDFNIFMLNKKNGIGVWSKIETNLILTDNPGAQAYHLICR